MLVVTCNLHSFVVMSNDTDGCERADDSTDTQALAGEFYWRHGWLKATWTQRTLLRCLCQAICFSLSSVLFQHTRSVNQAQPSAPNNVQQCSLSCVQWFTVIYELKIYSYSLHLYIYISNLIGILGSSRQTTVSGLLASLASSKPISNISISCKKEKSCILLKATNYPILSLSFLWIDTNLDN